MFAKSKKSWLVAGALVLAVGMMSAITAVNAAADDSNMAKDFTLKDSNGTSHSLSDFKGKWVVLEWTNQGCPFVKKFYKEGHMQDLQAKYTEKDVVWLTICSSAKGKQGHCSPEEWNSEVDSKKIKSTAVLIDEDGTVGKMYKAKTTPHMFVINPKGEVVYNGAIDSKKSASTKDIEKADNYVVAALEAGMAGKEIKVKSSQPYGCGVKY